MKIISLVDNISNRSNIGSEHGLSFYIETEKHKLLFDLGSSDLYFKNAQVLGIDLKAVDTVVISHGHYDHGGGLKHFMSINSTAKIYIHIDAFDDFYSIKQKSIEYIGLDKSLSDNPRISFVHNDIVIDDKLQLFSNVKMHEKRFSLNKQLKEKKDGKYKEDNFLHEQNLIIYEKGAKALIAGCSHNGITNIIQAFISITGGIPNFVFGGFHLSASGCKHESEKVIHKLAERLDEWDAKYFTCHCTGTKPYQLLKQTLNDKIDYFLAGNEINL